MKVWVYSTHRSQEFDLVRMFLREGIKVQGVFDAFSRQRPSIRGITDPDSIPGREKAQALPPGEETWSSIVERDRNLETESKDFKGFDWYLMMEVPERGKRLEHYASMGMNTAIQCFGQESEDEDNEIVPVLKKRPNAHLVCYSPQLVDRYIALGVSRDQLHMIRFGIFPEEWQPAGGWVGDMLIALTACNSMQFRGDGVSWAQYQAISAGLPFVLIGKDTEQVGGMGEQTYHALKWWYARANAYMAMGTKPAPYTMTPMEAMMSGCPILFWDNEFGIRNEEWAQGLFITGDIQDARNYIALILDRKIDVLALSKKSRYIATTFFNAHTIAKEWLRFFSDHR